MTARAASARAFAATGLCLAALAAAEPSRPGATPEGSAQGGVVPRSAEPLPALPLTSLPSSARPRPRRARGAAPASPLDGPLEISSPFDPARLHPVLGKRLPHLGVDLVAPAGASVRAIDAGVVVAVERRRREGNLVAIEHGRGLESQYWHLRDVDRGVRRGARVRRGEVIGRVGSTGLSTAPHLHLALRRGGRHVDPMTVLGPPRDRAAR